MANVWVVQENNHDYSMAEKFGTVNFITTLNYTAIPNSEQNKNVIHDIKNFSSQYIPGVDFIVPAGNPITVALVVMSLQQYSNLSHNFLKWDGRAACYVPFSISPMEVIQ